MSKVYRQLYVNVPWIVYQAESNPRDLIVETAAGQYHLTCEPVEGAIRQAVAEAKAAVAHAEAEAEAAVIDVTTLTFGEYYQLQIANIVAEYNVSPTRARQIFPESHFAGDYQSAIENAVKQGKKPTKKILQNLQPLFRWHLGHYYSDVIFSEEAIS